MKSSKAIAPRPAGGDGAGWGDRAGCGLMGVDSSTAYDGAVRPLILQPIEYHRPLDQQFVEYDAHGLAYVALRSTTVAAGQRPPVFPSGDSRVTQTVSPTLPIRGLLRVICPLLIEALLV